jgi:hypothetical protein
LSLPRLERIDLVLQALKDEGGKLTYAALRQLIVKTTRVSFETAEKYIEEMAAMGSIKSVDVFWILVTKSEKEAIRTKERS